MRQCDMDTFKAPGPGSQYRNKRESAVRLKHLPTGVILSSQHKNRAPALRRLRTLLALKEAAKLLGYMILNFLSCLLSTGALSRLILADDSLRMPVNDLRISKVEIVMIYGRIIAMVYMLCYYYFVAVEDKIISI
ncbi:hypothetical protein JCGZ_03611 [Jatropha curcas]|uniref:Prokaryotic-type class I peptide chain release factors domain-containing protein n=1 Tax=Jatropha curcas TaxID=180498 RepID=A0A067L9E0_JATCU|nr:hypothetical protein JCGZ_03611 [Jatropha curcas]